MASGCQYYCGMVWVRSELPVSAACQRIRRPDGQLLFSSAYLDRAASSCTPRGLSYCSASTFDKARQPRVRHARYSTAIFMGSVLFLGGPKTGNQTSCRAEPFADGLSRAKDGGFEVTEPGHFLSS